MTLKYDARPSNVAFSSNLRRYTQVRGLGEGNLAAGVSAPHAAQVMDLVDRLLACGESGEGRQSVEASEAQRGVNEYAGCVRERVLRRLEAGARTEEKEQSRALQHTRSSFGNRAVASRKVGRGQSYHCTPPWMMDAVIDQGRRCGTLNPIYALSPKP